MVRMNLKHDEDEHESIDDSHTPTVAMFLGECCGVRLVWRGEKDPHVCFEILGEDDGHWFAKQGFSSSYWMPDLIEVVAAANDWMTKNLTPDLYKGVQFGYKVNL